MFKLIAVAIVAVVLGAALTMVAVHDDIDLLSTAKSQIVVLQEDLVVRNASGKQVLLPAGTTLTFESQYSDEATLKLKVVTTKLDSFALAPDAQAAYYVD